MMCPEQWAAERTQSRSSVLKTKLCAPEGLRQQHVEIHPVLPCAREVKNLALLSLTTASPDVERGTTSNAKLYQLISRSLSLQHNLDFVMPVSIYQPYPYGGRRSPSMTLMIQVPILHSLTVGLHFIPTSSMYFPCKNPLCEYPIRVHYHLQ